MYVQLTIFCCTALTQRTKHFTLEKTPGRLLQQLKVGKRRQTLFLNWAEENILSHPHFSTADAKADHPLQSWDTTRVLRSSAENQFRHFWSKPNLDNKRTSTVALASILRSITTWDSYFDQYCTITCTHHEVTDILITSWNPLLSITGVFP